MNFKKTDKFAISGMALIALKRRLPEEEKTDLRRITEQTAIPVIAITVNIHSARPSTAVIAAIWLVAISITAAAVPFAIQNIYNLNYLSDIESGAIPDVLLEGSADYMRNVRRTTGLKRTTARAI